MKKDQNKEQRVRTAQPLPDESLRSVAGGDASEPGQPTAHTRRNDYAATCSNYQRVSYHTTSNLPRYCVWCTNGVDASPGVQSFVADKPMLCKIYDFTAPT